MTCWVFLCTHPPLVFFLPSRRHVRTGVEVEDGGDHPEDVRPFCCVGGGVADDEVLDEALVHLARAVVRRGADLVLDGDSTGYRFCQINSYEFKYLW